MQVLKNDPDAPHDLREKSLQLAGRLIEFDADVRGGEGYDIARNILDSGRAMEKMNQIIDAQGKQTAHFPVGHLTREIAATSSGTVVEIDNLIMARIARLAGAPMDKGAGVMLLKKLGDTVKAGDPLYRIHAEFPSDFEFATRHAQQNQGYRISEHPHELISWLE